MGGLARPRPEKLLELVRTPPEDAPGTGTGIRGIVGNSRSIADVRKRLARIALSEANVLITGETGTGKELIAAALHSASPRRQRNFVCINCAALPDALLESELFGHQRGAFTGAYQMRPGKLRHSNGGTVFLDEIGELSPYAQAKLLRAIESREIQSVGGDSTSRADFRTVAATNHDLEARMSEGLFRADLYYRLNVARIHLSPLRERMEDLEVLIAHFLKHFNKKFSLSVEGVLPETLDCLRAHTWPGNVRELRNVLEAAYLSVEGPLIRLSDIPQNLRATHPENSQLTEKQRLLNALNEVNWNKSQTAEMLHWSRMTVYRKIAKYRISSPSSGNGGTPAK